MNPQPNGLKPPRNQNTSPSSAMRAHQLTVMRAASVTSALVAVMLFVAGLPWLYLYYYSTVEPTNLSQLGLSAPFYAAYRIVLDVVVALACFILATVIFLRRSEQPMALFVALMLVLLGTTYSDSIVELSALHPVLEWLSYILGPLALGSLFVFFYIFPDGRFVPRWTRWLAILWLAWVLIVSFFPHLPINPDDWPLWGYVVVMSCWLFTGIFTQVYRYRRVSDPVQRQQIKWVVFGFTAALLGYLGTILFEVIFSPIQRGSLADYPIGGSLADLAIVTIRHFLWLFVPLTFAIAILRYRLWDIDPIINRTLVYGTLTASVIGLYVLVVEALGALLWTQGNLLVSLLATGLIAVLFSPLRDRLQRGVNRLMYGERDDPYGVLSRLGRRLEGTLAPDAALSIIVETVAQALKLPYAAIALKRDDGEFATAAEYGTPVREPVVLPLAYQRQPVGHLILAPRAPGEAFSPSDRRLLEDLARQTGVAVHAVRLTTDLQRSRERLVTAREEERRRLRRDLHDGLGPQLASLTMMSEAAHDLVPLDQARAQKLLEGLTEQAQEAVADVRRLVYALRPPALDTLGLMGALRSQVPQDDALRITIDGPEELPELPAAVEVAAYRITLEALTNVMRHAGARNCRVRLSLDEETGTLRLEVEDDGRGIGEDRRTGVGLTSMRERAEELSGACTIDAVPSGGTRVHAFLPYGRDDMVESEADELQNVKEA